MLGPGGRVDHHKIDAAAARSFQGLRHARGLRVDHEGAFRLPPITPVAGGSLGIEVNNECAQAVLLGGDSKAERQCGFACSTFLGYEGNSLLVVKLTCLQY